ncbi:protein transport protein sec22 protein [Apiospora arundinis]|uniref:Uncharacterized protein n=1 Tax=Apiospora arundinis TaxID=335852 RepID=A0ABR2IKU2_9PEZI
MAHGLPVSGSKLFPSLSVATSQYYDFSKLALPPSLLDAPLVVLLAGLLVLLFVAIVTGSVHLDAERGVVQVSTFLQPFPKQIVVVDHSQANTPLDTPFASAVLHFIHIPFRPQPICSVGVVHDVTPCVDCVRVPGSLVAGFEVFSGNVAVGLNEYVPDLPEQ